MVTHKRITWLLLSILAVSISLLVSAKHGKGETNIQPQRTRAKVLRRKDQFKLKLTDAEARMLKNTQSRVEERELEDAIPKQVPLKVRIKKEKEKAFRDLKNEKWARDFELEVTNTGDKPIYEFYLLLITDIKAAAGYRIVAPLYYGRTELGDLKVLATPEDIPVMPGESTILKIHPGQLEAWEILQRKENRAYPKKITIKFQRVNFGDGTGYGPGGLVFPRPSNERSSLNRCMDQPNKGDPKSLPSKSAEQGSLRKRSSITDLPASFLPVKFLSSSKSFKSVSFEPNPNPQDCCPADGCTSLISHRSHVCLNCPNQERPTPTFCSDPRGSCYTSDFDSIECPLVNGATFTCQTITLEPCGGPTPPPTPTPSPTPTPTPVPCPFTSPGNCASGIPRDYCTNPEPPGINSGGCPPFYHADGSCCVKDPCPSPTPAPPACDGTLYFNEVPVCSWTCFPPVGGGGGGGEGGGGGGGYYYCTEYWWVWYESWDGGQTWEATGQVEYAGCW
ncbi:MAG: hypothetical protein QOF62_484 [Pyrinomonadaceae bacterium]|jgi:hypothetical protein|nr:hypothetical protein [Pyrinomonadaceae bacterium]